MDNLIKDKMIELLTDEATVQQEISIINKVTHSDILNKHINVTVDLLRISGKTKFSELPITLKISTAICHLIVESTVTIHSETDIRQFLSSLEGVSVSALSSSIYGLLG